MLPSTDIPPQVLPVRALLATLLACVGVSYWLVPSDSEMVERLMLDQQYERLASILNSEIGAGSNVSSHLLKSLNSAQITELSHLLSLTPKEQLANIFDASRPLEYNPIIHGLVMAAVRYVNVVPPEQAWKYIAPHADQMTTVQFLDLTLLLGQGAMAEGRPGLAAEIYDRACAMPESTASTVESMLQAYRWSAHAGTGAAHVRVWLKIHASAIPEGESKHLALLAAQAALEGGDAKLAFSICLEQFELLPPNGVPDPAQMELAVGCAQQAGQTGAVLPWVKRFVGAMPQSTMALKALHESSKSSSSTLSNYVKWVGRLADFADWNSDFEEGFDQHCRLAAMGRLESLDRCVALWDFLGCGQEMAALLQELGPVIERPAYQLVLAELLAGLGQDKEARPLYEQWMESHPNDREAHYDLACLLEDMGEEDASLACFRQLVERHPNDVQAIKKLAENCIRSQNFDEALNLYSRLRDEDQDHYTLENYAMIAESLDKHEALFKAQWLTAKAANPPLAEPYLDMAETAGYLADREGAIELIEQGIQRLPCSAAIRVALADLWVNEDEYAKAWAVLKHDCVRQNFDGILRILSLAREMPDREELLSFLGSDVEKRFALPPSVRLDLAVLCATNGQSSRSQALFSSVPVTPKTVKLLARARFAAGQNEQAAILMEEHVASKVDVTAEDLILLGDVYDLMGRDEDSQKAYAASIDLIAPDHKQASVLPSLPAPLAKHP